MNICTVICWIRAVLTICRLICVTGLYHSQTAMLKFIAFLWQPTGGN